jgi:hypothetical protein
MTSRTEELYIQTRNHPVCGYLIPLESVLAYPIPVVEKSGRVLLKFVAYQRGGAPRGEPRPVYPPHARITVEYPSGRLVEYVDLRSQGQVDAVGKYPHTAIANISVKDILEKKADLYQLTDSLIDLIGRVPNTDHERNLVIAYKEFMATLFEPGLLSFYRELNPAFFEWLESV